MPIPRTSLASRAASARCSSCSVLQLLARGHTDREIAAELVISVKTASVHVLHILRKLDVASRIDAARIAHRLTPPSLAAPED
jgi:DNA-binding NarL/FixJ family response regulator